MIRTLLISYVSCIKIELPFKYTEEQENLRDNNYTIKLQPNGNVEVDMTALASYCRNGTSTDLPLRAIQALDTALKYGAAQRLVCDYS